MVLHHLQFIFVYVGKCKANFVFTMCAICNTLTIRGHFWKNLIIRDDIMNIMKNAVKMRYQNSPGMWRKHTPSALDKWYDKLESDCDIQFVVFFCFVDLLTSELVLIDPFMTGPITYAGLMTASSILSSSERMRERKHHKVTDRKKREKENINIIYWGE